MRFHELVTTPEFRAGKYRVTRPELYGAVCAEVFDESTYFGFMPYDIGDSEGWDFIVTAEDLARTDWEKCHAVP